MAHREVIIIFVGADCLCNINEPAECTHLVRDASPVNQGNPLRRGRGFGVCPRGYSDGMRSKFPESSSFSFSVAVLELKIGPTAK